MMEPLIRPLARATRPRKQEIEALAEQVAIACVRMVRATTPKLTSIRKIQEGLMSLTLDRMDPAFRS